MSNGRSIDSVGLSRAGNRNGARRGHSYADIAGLSTLAQTIYAQGTKVDPVNGTMSTAANAVNPFNFLDDRLLAGTTYTLKYHLGYDVLWTPAWANQSSTSQYFDKITTWGERQNRSLQQRSI